MGVEHLHQTTDAEALYADARVRVAAFMVELAHRGVMLDVADFEAAVGGLADAAEAYGATPEEVQAALVRREASLRAEPPEFAQVAFRWGEPTFNPESSDEYRSIPD